MFSRRWVFATLLVFAGTLVLVRLGVWQLDRLETRRANNAHYLAMQSMPPLDLAVEIPSTLTEMEYRAVTASGTYDFENQVAVRNQYYQGQYGYELLTPLLFDGKAVLVKRGWIPADGNPAPADWRKYDQPGEIKVAGVIRLGSGKPAFGGMADALPADGSRLEIWNNADVARIAGQMPYPILQIYIQLETDPNDATPPIPSAPEFVLTEGPHLGYAVQWFTFAAILFFGYPFFLRKQDLDPR
jgi:surfeit locus 1 family protein